LFLRTSICAGDLELTAFCLPRVLEELHQATCEHGINPFFAVLGGELYAITRIFLQFGKWIGLTATVLFRNFFFVISYTGASRYARHLIRFSGMESGGARRRIWIFWDRDINIT
jgi:hypothetical protein